MFSLSLFFLASIRNAPVVRWEEEILETLVHRFSPWCVTMSQTKEIVEVFVRFYICRPFLQAVEQIHGSKV